MNSKASTSTAQVSKTQSEKFDLVILGGETRSTIAAWTFAGGGKLVAVIDRRYLGGSRPNTARLPGKNIIRGVRIGR